MVRGLRVGPRPARERPPEELPSASPFRSALSRAKASVPRAGVVTCDVVNVGRCWRRFLLTGGRGKEGWRASGDCVTCCEEHVQTPQDSDLNPGMWTRGHRSVPSIPENTEIYERRMRGIFHIPSLLVVTSCFLHDGLEISMRYPHRVSSTPET
jgi:hypothetical protein